MSLICQGHLLAALTAISGEEAGIFVATDIQYPEDYFEQKQLGFIQPLPVATENTDNVAIVNLNGGKKISPQAPFFFDVKNFSDEPHAFDVVFETPENRELAKTEMRLEGEENLRYVVEEKIREQLPQDGNPFVIRLALRDALELDNQVYVSMNDDKRADLYLVSPLATFVPAARAFAGFYNFRFTYLNQSEFAAQTFKPEDIILFHSFFPQTLVQYNAVGIGTEEQLRQLDTRHRLTFPPLTHPHTGRD